jgi:hypothetical protein
MPINDPILYYTCDSADTIGSTITDRGSGGNNGTLAGSPGSATGKIKQALTFNGSSQYVTAGTPTALDITGAITVSAWIYPTSLPTGGDDGTPSHYANIIEKGYDGLNEQYAMSLQGGNIGWYTYGGSTNLIHGMKTSYGTSISVNTWTHVCGTYDGSAWNIYINGAAFASVTDSQGPIHASAPFSVGAASINGAFQRFFTGSLDEVRVYSRALSSTEVAALYAYTGAFSHLLRLRRKAASA